MLPACCTAAGAATGGRPIAALVPIQPATSSSRHNSCLAATLASNPAAAKGQRQQRVTGSRRKQRLPPPSAALPPELEGLTIGGSGAASAGLLDSLLAAVAQHPTLYSLELLLTVAGGYVAAVWPDRPRGWCFKELIEVRSSAVAGKGVFAAVHIAEGTVVGAYPGRPRTGEQMKAKCETAPLAQYYCFRARSGLLLDPTDEAGQLSTAPAPGLPWLPIDYTLAYVNEPPKGAGGTNVTVEDDPDDPSGLLCVAARDIQHQEELFMDYGVHYDRSLYRAGSQGEAAGGAEGSGQARQREQQAQQR